MDLPNGWTLEEHADELAFAMLEHFKRADGEEVEWLAVHEHQQKMEVEYSFTYMHDMKFPRGMACHLLWGMRERFVQLVRGDKIEGRLGEVLDKVCEFYEWSVKEDWPKIKAEIEAEDATQH